MAIQILGLRDYQDKETGETRKRDTFLNENWRAPSVKDLFANIEYYLSLIPQDKRYNLFYTAARCAEQRGRLFLNQDILPIDIDGIDRDKLSDYIGVVCECLGIDYEQTGVVATGNGLHFLIGLDEPIDYEEYFDETRVFYKALCGNINHALFEAGLPGNADPSIWSRGRLLRLPGTQNIKPNKPKGDCRLLQANIEHVPFDLIEKSGMPVLDPGDDYINDRMFSKMPKPDGKGVQGGCEFIKWAGENPNDLGEPQWYALLSIIARLPEGRDLAHQYSSGYEHYNEMETDRKIDQSLTASGPRTCKNIESLWDGCQRCPNYGKCVSPIQLQSTEFIPTQSTGFHKVIITDKGAEKATPQYSDLCKYFEQKHPYITHEEGRMVYIWEEGVWSDVNKLYIDAFAEKHFDPDPTNQVVSEFYGKITRRNLRNNRWFQGHHGHINFTNGVLDLDTRALTEHDPVYPFRYKLPFDYDPTAECPRFDQYMKEVTCKDEQLECVLLEFMGYALSGMNPELGQKALILTGDGSNGKSVFLDLLKYMAGYGNYSTLSMGYEIAKMENRQQLDGKLFNLSEEVPDKALADSSIFKSLVTGGEIQARKLYCDAYSMKSNAKILMACNSLPPTTDDSYGIFRRLLIAPFRAIFTKENMDIHIRDKLYAEAPGIFNRVLEALDRFKKQGAFTEAKAIEVAVEHYKVDNNMAYEWFLENCIPTGNPDDVIIFKDLYKRFRLDMEDNGVRNIPDIRKLGTLFRKFVTPNELKKKRYPAGTHTKLCLVGHQLAQEVENDDF